MLHMWYQLAVYAFLFAFVAVNATPVQAQARLDLRGPPRDITSPQQPLQPPALVSNCVNNCAFQANGCTSICPAGAAQTLCVQNCSLQQTSCQQVCNGLR